MTVGRKLYNSIEIKTIKKKINIKNGQTVIVCQTKPFEILQLSFDWGIFIRIFPLTLVNWGCLDCQLVNTAKNL